jgi:class 3 adenylate cyclase
VAELLRGRYEVLEVAGHGGEGQVVKALDRQLERVVALKIRPMVSGADRSALLTEARVLLGMRPHPNLPLVREDFFDGDRYVIAMDWVEGIDLARVLQTRGRPGLAPTLVMNWLADAAAALTHLHAQSPPVVHGDVKPANLILGPEGRVTLVDFGVSSTPGLVPRRAGTRGYAAPELGGGAAINRASDIYALAATAFALLSGAPPSGVLPEWEGIDPVLAAEIEDALRAGLATDPARRPATEGELVERLRAGWTSTLPSGVLTFCATDIEDAGALWDRSPSEMARAVLNYSELVAETVEHHGGRFVTSMADATVSVFSSPRAAVDAARSLATRLADEPPTDGITIGVRIGLNTGEAGSRDGDYSGPALRGAARARDLASHGEILVARATADVVRAHLPEGTALVDVGGEVFALASDDDASPPAGTVCPYPGLVAFGASDAERFVGREAMLQGLIARLDHERFIALVGASGSGKSSLLRAGLVPLVDGATVVTPGAHPMRAYSKCALDR